MSGEERWCVVTGGRGFAARHLVEMLIKQGVYSVRIADLGQFIDLDSAEENGVVGQALQSGRAQYICVDLRHKAQVLKACEGAQVVFHMAAPNSSINNQQLHYLVNVQGTKNVIDACVELSVKRLIYTSSPSVVFDGIHGIINGNELLPYPAKHIDSYSATKMEGEKLVIDANGTNGLLTCCIRPSGIFGPGDKLFVPSLVSAARAGKAKFIIGDGNNVYDFTYVENVAHAHICAEKALAAEGQVSKNAAGEPYFVTNLEPIKFWEFTSLVLEGLGYERPRIKIPALAVMPIAHVVEWMYKLCGSYGMKIPQLTPSRIRLLSCSRSFDCSKARERLGYTPMVSLQEGLKRTLETYPHLRAEHQPKREGPSKASVCLGNGKVADTLLWKDKKKMLIALLVLVGIYYDFIATQSTIIAVLMKLFLLASIFLFIHGSLPEKILGYSVEKIPASHFHLSEDKSQCIVQSVASSWNVCVNILKSLCRGNDWMLFLKVVLSFLILSLLGAMLIQRLFIIGIPIAFTALLVYDKMEREIDAMAMEVLSVASRIKCDVVKRFLISKTE